jgi:hypothetical protein
MDWSLQVAGMIEDCSRAVGFPDEEDFLKVRQNPFTRSVRTRYWHSDFSNGIFMFQRNAGLHRYPLLEGESRFERPGICFKRQSRCLLMYLATDLAKVAKLGLKRYSMLLEIPLMGCSEWLIIFKTEVSKSSRNALIVEIQRQRKSSISVYQGKGWVARRTYYRDVSTYSSDKEEI